MNTDTMPLEFDEEELHSFNDGVIDRCTSCGGSSLKKVAFQNGPDDFEEILVCATCGEEMT